MKPSRNSDWRSKHSTRRAPGARPALIYAGRRVGRVACGAAREYGGEGGRGHVGVVAAALAELAALRISIRELPLFAAIEQIIAGTALRARLAALPADDFKDPLGDLDALMTQAAQAGATGAP